MTKDKPRYSHPNPTLDRFIQYGALIVTGVMLASAPLQVLLTLLGAPGGLFILSAFFTVVLSAPVLMLTAYAPAVSIETDALILHPRIWKTRRIPWESIRAVKVYSLLPTEDQETNRKWVVGRRNYRPAAGIMLIIPGLPAQYRIAGFLAGERAAPAIALTSRAHTNYDHLAQEVLKRTDPAIHDPELNAGS